MQNANLNVGGFEGESRVEKLAGWKVARLGGRSRKQKAESRKQKAESRKQIPRYARDDTEWAGGGGSIGMVVPPGNKVQS